MLVGYPTAATHQDHAMVGRSEATGGPAPLVGRDELVRDVLDVVADDSVPVMTLLGTAGAGSSALLDAVSARVGSAMLVRLRLAEADQATDYCAAHRVLTAATSAARGDHSAVAASVVAALAKNGVGKQPAQHQLAVATSMVLRRLAPLVVLVDDAHWADDGSVELLAASAEHLAGSACTIIAAMRRSPARDARSKAFDGLLRRGLARSRSIRPFTARQSAAVLAEVVGAVPDTSLATALHDGSRGNPALLLAGAAACRRAGAIGFVDRHAVLRRGSRVPPADVDVVPGLRTADGFRWRVTKCLAVYECLGADAVELTGRALGASEQRVLEVLAGLEADRTLRRTRAGGAGRPLWRFSFPAVRESVLAAVGPFERRLFASVAVKALWSGDIPQPDDGVLADFLADAGTFVDAERSVDELVRCAADDSSDDPRVMRWLAAAAELAPTRRQRAAVLAEHCAACVRHGRMADAERSARTVFETGTVFGTGSPLLQPRQWRRLALHRVLALAACGEDAELRRVTDLSAHWLPPDRLHRELIRAIALCLLNRWAEAGPELRRYRARWGELDSQAAWWGRRFDFTAAVLCGAQPVTAPVEQRGGEVPPHHSLLLALAQGDPRREAHEPTDSAGCRLHAVDRFQVQWRAGNWDRAMRIARSNISGEPGADLVGRLFMHHGAIQVLTAQGWLGRARNLVAEARCGRLEHVLDHAEATVLRLLGADDAAHDLLLSGLRRAEATGLVIGTETLLADLARHQARQGDHEQAEDSLRRLGRVAGRIGTDAARLELLVARASVLGDPSSAEAAISLARERSSPFETAIAFSRIAQTGLRPRELLLEAYCLLGPLGALLWRARLRRCMQDYDVSVPGRSETLRENEQLLAVLVTEGLSNRQLAAVFGTSEKSVAARLSRMFTRSGYRSRVELAAAMLTGDFQT
ncbi:AAA family ATPase [Saccharopolyspora shandongensis]|uniref:AAA family ATPase n=1 Tax=Saccharopolyspora shandongensis TaxID=418495 RepID=UPI0034346A3E